ncbi:substrate-binding domain-containing protein [Cetobacterium sp. 2A]|uniref:substrate-binding domain-containing protein n=1 Tax=unclassified Cetobacterium TaxID=2630983 RepID=UPI00163CC246|nr:substrate-binding domain-containing protein [Cetobacterium sp. 2A]MBC2854989.1 substrate-binding domain-containing protein [Cetobacterium sp. 2A]
MNKILLFMGALTFSLTSFSGEILMGTTTSLDDTGFLKVVSEKLKAKTGVELKYLSRGTGEALELGKRGDVDILFTHDKAREEKFIKDGFGTKRHEMMYNYFMIVTANDNDNSNFPKDLNSVMKKISDENLVFLSRGDKSGTHSKELAIWKAVGITPKFENYKETGVGMAKTLNITSELKGYTVSDYGTFETLKNKFGLKNIELNDKTELKNTYAIVELSKTEKSKEKDIQTFIEFMNSPEMDEVIKTYGKDTLGTNLFFRENN